MKFIDCYYREFLTIYIRKNIIKLRKEETYEWDKVLRAFLPFILNVSFILFSHICA